MSQEQVGDRLGGKAGSTVSHYESGKIELTADMADAFALALGVPVREIKVFSDEELKEDAVPYRTRSVPVELISDGLLRAIKSELSGRVGEAEGRELSMLLAAVGEIGAELSRRPAMILHEKKKGVSLPLSADELAAGKEFVEKQGAGGADAGAGGGLRGSPKPPGAGERHLRKVPPPRSSSGESMTERPGSEDKDRK